MLPVRLSAILLLFCLRDLTSRSRRSSKADFEAYLDGFSPNVQKEILESSSSRNQIDTR